jgi:hypothetical protein
MSEPPQAGRHTLREIAASLWEDGLGDVILAIANGDVVAIGSEEMTNATIADRDDATGFLVQMDPWTAPPTSTLPPASDPYSASGTTRHRARFRNPHFCDLVTSRWQRPT